MIRIGNKIIVKSLEAGIRPGVLIKVEEGPQIELKANMKKDTIRAVFEMNINGNKLERSKDYIATNVKDSEIGRLIDNLLPELDVEKDGVNLEDLIGKECNIEITVDYSKRGNRFENIGQVTLRADESVSTDKEARA